MRAGYGRGEFYVLYQPILSAAEGRITGVEALARWTHPVEGPIPPDIFIGIAENTRFVAELGAYVAREACTALAATNLKLSVNLSPVQMLDPQLVATVSRILVETGFPAERLEFEITELHAEFSKKLMHWT